MPPRRSPAPARRAARAAARLRVPPATLQAILDRLEAQHPDADTELTYTSAYELLVATMLSAQSSDQRVNLVTPALFRRYPNAASLARASAAELEPQIVATGFFRTKARSLLGMAHALVEQHGGEVPASMAALVKLPGVGRKTANVVLGHALGVPGLPVDRHVLRVTNRIGLVKSEDPVLVEAALASGLPPEGWTRASDTWILHGRRICRPRPLCDRCAVRSDCEFYRRLAGAARHKPARAKSPASRASSRAARPVSRGRR